MNSPKPKKPQPNSNQDSQQPERPLSLQEKLQQAQSQQQRFALLAADPSLSLPAALAARSLARSYGAAATLGQKALDYEAQVNDPESQGMLMRALGINPLLPDQGRSSQNPTP